MNGEDVVKRPRGMFIIDFGCDAPIDEACRFATPFRLIQERVRPARSTNRRESYAERWWIHVEPRPAMRDAVTPLRRVLLTPRVSKHRIFAWSSTNALPDSRLFVFAREDDWAFGVLQSPVHELWTLRLGSRHGDGDEGGRPAYNATSCFETFSLPWPPGREDVKHPAYVRISEAAKELNGLRERWLNPPEWIDEVAAKVDAADAFADVPADARALIRRSAIMALAAKDARLKKRTLTNLYNERPQWLKLAHEMLDRAVLAAYAATDPEGKWSEDWAAVWVDAGAGQPLPDDHPFAAERRSVDQQVLSMLLRLNQERATVA